MKAEPRPLIEKTALEGASPREPYTHCRSCAHCILKTRTSRKTNRTTVTATCTLSGIRINPQYPKCPLYKRRV